MGIVLALQSMPYTLRVILFAEELHYRTSAVSRQSHGATKREKRHCASDLGPQDAASKHWLLKVVIAVMHRADEKKR